MMEKRRNKFDGEQTYPMMGRALEGPCKLAGGGRRLPWTRGWGGEKNKQWSESVFGVTPYRAEPGTSGMSHGQFFIEVDLHIISILIHIF
jgi:hypothetical protein